MRSDHDCRSSVRKPIFPTLLDHKRPGSLDSSSFAVPGISLPVARSLLGEDAATAYGGWRRKVVDDVS